MPSLDLQVVHIPLAYGLQSKVDPRALTAPSLARARDVQFEELGGIQPRAPFAAMPLAIVGGGTVTSPRRLATVRDELLLFTSTSLYTWSDIEQGWLLRGEHPAAVVSETPVFVRTEDQVCADRAELSDVVVYAWVAQGASSQVMVAAIDALSGATLLAPLGLGASTTRPRLIALSAAILLFYEDAAGVLRAHAIDPAAIVVTPGAGTLVVAAATFNQNYDVVQSAQNPDNALLVHRQDVTTSYSIFRIPQTLAGISAIAKARPADGAIALAVAPSSANRVAVFRRDGGNLEADVLVESTFADSTINLAVGGMTGGADEQVTAAFRSTQDAGTFRCYVFWRSGAATVSSFNFVTSAGGVGSSATFAPVLTIGSRAFEYNGHVMLWLVYENATLGASGFGGELQNTYFLVRDDQQLLAKAAYLRAAGTPEFAAILPTVQTISPGVFAWAGTERRRIAIGTSQRGYGAIAPLDVVLAFDDDRARRWRQLGDTLYVTGGQILQYDGEGLAEVGFHLFPLALVAIPGTTGSMDPGGYAIKSSFRWENARGERDRGTSANTFLVTLDGGLGQDEIVVSSAETLFATMKREAPLGNRSPVAIEFWRTKVNAAPGVPSFLTSGLDPAVVAGDNRYVVNAPLSTFVAFNDGLADSVLAQREANPENGGVLPSLAPPAATIIEATQDRIILSGIADRPNAVHYSRLRGDGEVASFHGALRFELPPIGGRNTAVAFLNETMVVFQESAIFAVPGDGFGNVIGQGSNYGPGRLISSDLGAESPESVAFTPKGLLFKSRKGWYLMADWGPPRYVGAPVAAFDDELIRSTQVVESQHHIRILTEGRMLVWDYEADQWAEWPIADLAHGVLWRGQHVVIAGAEVLAQSDTLGAPVQLDVETGWIATGGIQGFQRVWWIMVLGQLLSTCRVRIRLARDYVDDVYFDDKIWTPSPGTIGGPMQVRHGPSIQQVQGLKVRITALHASLDQAPVGGGFNLTALSLECGVQQGLFRSLPAAQRQ